MDDPRDPEEGGSFQWGPDTNADGTGPLAYVFSTDDVSNIRNTGAPEVTTKFRSSFDPEPHWLDDATWYDVVRSSDRAITSDVKDGLRLDSVY